MTASLDFGFSPCPNDTFAFHALVAGLVDEPLEVLGALPRGLGDGGERLLGPRRVGVHEALPCSGLDDHHADGVPDDVVQLTGDAGALVSQGDLAEQLALARQLLGPQRQLLGGLVAQA